MINANKSVLGGIKIKIKFMLITAYLGAVIGAGFASGQEIVQFFVNYGGQGLKGAFLAAFLFAASGSLLMSKAHRLKVADYQSVLEHILGPITGRIIDTMLAIFLFLGVSTMFSASGAVFYEHLYLPKNMGIIAAYLAVGICLIRGKRGLILSYNLLVPLKIILLLGISAWVAFSADIQYDAQMAVAFMPAQNEYWIIASLLYVSYNFSLAMVVLTEFQSLSRRGDAIMGAWWGGLALGSLVIITYLALFRFMPIVMHYQVPMLFIAGQVSLLTKKIYTLVLWVGILTTALANAYGFSRRFAAFTGVQYGISLFLCITLALPLSFQSFSQLVGKIYPLFGLLGIIIVGGLWIGAGKDIFMDLYYNKGRPWAGKRR